MPVSQIALLAILQDLTLLQDAMTAASAGALLEGAVAYRHERRGGGQKSAWIVTRWAWVGVGIVLFVHVVTQVLSAA